MSKRVKRAFIPFEGNNYKPRFLEGDFLIYLVVILIVLKLLIFPFLACMPKISLFADIHKSLLIEMTNEQRIDMGLAPLAVSVELSESALMKAQDIIDYDYFSHFSPQGKSPWHWIKKTGYDYKAAGENLGIGFIDSEEIYMAWNDSPSHRANLLSPNYDEIGIAVITGEFEGKKTTIVVQHFGSPKVTIETPVQSPVEPFEPPIEPSEPEVEPEATTTVLGQTDQGAGFKILKFIASKYNDIIQNILILALGIVFISLMINIFVAIRIQDVHLISRAVMYSLFLLIFIFVNKDLLIKLIPHTIGI